MTDKLDPLKATSKKRQELQDQLERQLMFEERYHIAPHDIASIVLVPNGRNHAGFITYSSVVTTKCGEEHLLPVNVKALLDGKFKERR